jgi:23S rRNA (cytidine1920-2'-O)/16S rRNA (cytidine1409-2'-O)-methyltransferase
MPDRLVTSRLDTEVVRRGLAPSRDKARVLVMAGEVFIDGQCVLKADKKSVCFPGGFQNQESDRGIWN